MAVAECSVNCDCPYPSWIQAVDHVFTCPTACPAPSQSGRCKSICLVNLNHFVNCTYVTSTSWKQCRCHSDAMQAQTQTVPTPGSGNTVPQYPQSTSTWSYRNSLFQRISQLWKLNKNNPIAEIRLYSPHWIPKIQAFKTTEAVEREAYFQNILKISMMSVLLCDGCTVPLSHTDILLQCNASFDSRAFRLWMGLNI